MNGSEEEMGGYSFPRVSAYGARLVTQPAASCHSTNLFGLVYLHIRSQLSNLINTWFSIYDTGYFKRKEKDITTIQKYKFVHVDLCPREYLSHSMRNS